MRLKNLGLSTLVALALLTGAAASYAASEGNGEAAKVTETAAHGETAGHAEGPVDPVKEELDYGTLLVTIAIFVCMVIVLRFTAWKPILSGLQARETAIRDSVEAAQRAREEADRTTKDLEAKMAEVQRQAAQQLLQAKADAQKLADTIRQQAETEAAAIKDRTLREIDGAKQEALSAINGYAAELGTAVASKILQRNVTTDDQQRLVDESLAELARKN
ncbi:MAG TPA: F0F1 ATP synthase subunit B [Phycisphaerae bacterium]|nr:F0F1 ATP synthase subunit B [Phycisphaerae bacterium]